MAVQQPQFITGRKYGKIDLDRVGFFDDAVSGPFDKYKKVSNVREDAVTGRQIQPGPQLKIFEKEFMRIFNGEALSEPWKLESKKRVLERKKNLGAREFQLGGPGKLHSTPNDFFGCFSDPSALDHAPHIKAKKKDGNELPNCKIKPNPIGGSGYADICLSPYPKHEFDPYDSKKIGKKEREGRFLTASFPRPYFPPDPYKSISSGPAYRAPRVSELPMIAPGKIYVPGPKRLGGCKAGCFDKFPRYESSPYCVKNKRETTRSGKWIGGYPSHREKYTKSVIDYCTKVSCNAKNYPEYRERVYPLRI